MFLQIINNAKMVKIIICVSRIKSRGTLHHSMREVLWFFGFPFYNHLICPFSESLGYECTTFCMVLFLEI